jgi:rod shape-determining protein MreD
MKPRVYVAILLLFIPLQAVLLNSLSIGGVKPDLGLAVLFIIGLLTGPVEAALVGVGMGLMMDIASASFLGLSGLMRGVFGLSAGLVGKGVLDISSPFVVLFLAGFSMAEGFLIALFMQATYGDVPLFTLFVHRMLPQALYTSLFCLGLLWFLVSRRGILPMLMRRNLQKER